MADSSGRLEIKDLRAGRNNVDPPESISETHCVEAINVDWWNTTLGRKRAGIASVTTPTNPFAGVISSLYRHVPGTDETLAELWGTDDSATPIVGRLSVNFESPLPVSLVQSIYRDGFQFFDGCGTGTLAATPTEGNLLIAYLFLGSVAVTGGITAPAGWTTLAELDEATDPYTVGIYYRVAGAAEPTSAFPWEWTGSSFIQTVHLEEWTNVDPVTPIDVAGTWTDDGLQAGTESVVSITTVTNGALDIVVGQQQHQGPTYVAPAGYATNLNNAAFGLFSKVIASPGATGTRAVGLPSTHYTTRMSFALRPVLVAATAWTTPTLKDAPTGNGWEFNYASFNGLLYIAYETAQDRLHCWDPYLKKVRRTGMNVESGIYTMTDHGSGAYPAVLRWYRVRYTEQRSGVTVRRGEPSLASNWTPSGSGDGIEITQGSPPNEDETHWELEVSLDHATYYLLATIAVGTTTYVDSADTTTYADGPLSDLTGTYTVQRAYRFLAVDQGRCLGFGDFRAHLAGRAPRPENNVEYSAVLGDLDVGDGERVPYGNFQGLDENDSGPATGLFGPVNGTFLAGKFRQFWQLTPTGVVSQPYQALAISKTVGPVGQKAVTIGDDETGNPAVYLMSDRGPYRWGLRGLEYIGKVIEDRTIGAAGGVSLNLAATHILAHLLWYPKLRQVWCWFATGTANDPNEGAMFGVGRTPPYYGGYSTEAGELSRWSRFTGGLATARCACLFSNTIGTTAMSPDLKPYIGSLAVARRLGKADTGTQEFGANYQAYLVTKAYAPWGEGFTGSVMGAQLTAVAQASVYVTVTTIGDYGAQQRADLVNLTPRGPETRVQPRVGGGVVLSGLQTVQWQIGDAVAANSTWEIDSLTVTARKEGPVTG